jgi:hypothetical protein
LGKIIVEFIAYGSLVLLAIGVAGFVMYKAWDWVKDLK